MRDQDASQARGDPKHLTIWQPDHATLNGAEKVNRWLPPFQPDQNLMIQVRIGQKNAASSAESGEATSRGGELGIESGVILA